MRYRLYSKKSYPVFPSYPFSPLPDDSLLDNASVLFVYLKKYIYKVVYTHICTLSFFSHFTKCLADSSTWTAASVFYADVIGFM